MAMRLALVLRAVLRLAAVGLCLKALGFTSTQRWLLGRGLAQPDFGRNASEARAADLAWAVSSATRVSHPRPACLTRSLALWSLLRDEGIESRVCFGARQVPAGLLAHAWVEVNGRVLNDDADVAQRFPPLL